jgi:hypothetical protein
MSAIDILNNDVLSIIFDFIPDYVGILRLVNKNWKNIIDSTNNQCSTDKIITIISTHILRGNDRLITWAMRNYPDNYNMFMKMAIKSASPNILNRLLMANKYIASEDTTIYDCLKENSSDAVDIVFKHWIKHRSVETKKIYDANNLIAVNLDYNLIYCNIDYNSLIAAAVDGKKVKFLNSIIPNTIHIIRNAMIKMQELESNNKKMKKNNFEIINISEGYKNLWNSLMRLLGTGNETKSFITMLLENVSTFDYELFNETQENPIFFQPLLIKLCENNKLDEIKYFYTHPKVMAYFNIIKKNNSDYNNNMYLSFLGQLSAAAYYGHLNVIKWFHDYFKIIKIYQYGFAMLKNAIHLPNDENDIGDNILHDNIIVWIYENYTFPEFFGTELFARAVRCSNISFLEWLLNIGCTFDIETITSEAITHNRQDNFEWLQTKIPNL